MRFTGSVVIGIILLIFGVILLLANIMGIRINFFRLFPGVILVILGIVVLFGQFGGQHEIYSIRRRLISVNPSERKTLSLRKD